MPLIIVFRPHQSPAWAVSCRDKQEVVNDFLNDRFDVAGLNAPCDDEAFDRIEAAADVDEKFSIACEIIGHDLNSLTVLESADEVFRYINEREYYGQHNKGIDSVWREACELGWVPEYRIADVEADGSLADVDNFFAQNDAAAVEMFRDICCRFDADYDQSDYRLIGPSGHWIPVDA